MNHYEKAADYHHRGFNCCQSVLAAFSDVTGLSEQASFDLAGGFGAGMQTGEVCGAIVGASLALGLLHPVDPAQPVPSKQRTGRLVKEFQRRFREKYGEVRCHPLLKLDVVADGRAPAARDMGLTQRCDILIVACAEILEDMIKEGL